MGLLALDGQGKICVIACPQNLPDHSPDVVFVHTCSSNHSAEDIKTYLQIFTTYAKDPLTGLKKLHDTPWELEGVFGLCSNDNVCPSCQNACVRWMIVRKEWWNIFYKVLKEFQILRGRERNGYDDDV